MFKKFRSFKNRKPVLFMVIGYAVLWILCCAILTELIGKRQFELYAQDYKAEVDYWIKNTLGDLQNAMLNEDFELDNEQTYVEMSFYQLLGILSYYTEGKMYASGEMVAYGSKDRTSDGTDSDDNVKYSVSVENPDKVFMMLYNMKSQRFEYYSCPISYFDKVIEETYAIKGKCAPKWNYGLGNSWGISLVEGYAKGDEFRPGKVEVTYTQFNNGSGGTYKSTDNKIIDCSEKGIPEGFEPMDMSCYEDIFFSPGVMIPGDGRKWINISESEMFSMGTDRYNEIFINYDGSVPNKASQLGFDVTCPEYRLGGRKYKDYDDYDSFRYSNKLSADWTSGIPIPFSFLNGDVILSLHTNLKAANGETVSISLECMIEDCLHAYRSEFFKDMFRIWLCAFVFFAILVIYAYKRFYSLQGKNRFHKSLINSMAHDLKTPLMVVQGFSENLKENVHTEKRDYYAENILENVNYLNSLIDKNLDFSKKKDFDTAEEETVYLSGLLNNTLSRYRKKLEEKKLTITRIGDTSMKGDPEILALVTDNLINNAIKYSPEDTQIEVLGKFRYFLVKNKAELSYAKNIQNLLAPLEMADDARTAGKGTGLGLSIANGIIQERGGRIKLSYNKRSKTFTCKVIVRKILGIF